MKWFYVVMGGLIVCLLLLCSGHTKEGAILFLAPVISGLTIAFIYNTGE